MRLSYTLILLTVLFLAPSFGRGVDVLFTEGSFDDPSLAAQPPSFDVIVVGAGTGGVAAAVWYTPHPRPITSLSPIGSVPIAFSEWKSVIPSTKKITTNQHADGCGPNEGSSNRTVKKFNCKQSKTRRLRWR